MEFDRYASNYDAGMNHPLKRVVGRSAEEFLAVKVRWLMRDFKSLERTMTTDTTEPLRVLDCGCGTGSFLRLLCNGAGGPKLYGCDVSNQMLEEAKRLLWSEDRSIALDVITQNRLPYEACRFEAVIVCCVLHHTTTQEREELLREAVRVLTPGGRLYVFEHNPWNPITRYVVGTTPIDCHATLVSPGWVRRCFRRIGLRWPITRYIMFLPPRWTQFHRLDNCLGWLPCGGQYVVRGIKP